MLTKGFAGEKCDELECMAYNVNLDLVLRLFKEYSSLKKVSIWSNAEKITYSPEHYDELVNIMKQKKLEFFTVPENVTLIHGKLYLFRKEGQIKFLALGSPNLSEYSNLNFESLVYLTSNCDEIWRSIPRIYADLSLIPKTDLPIKSSPIEKSTPKIDPQLLSSLWKHQVEVLMWLENKTSSIVNIPPGTGKTKIAFTYVQYLFGKDTDMTAIVLVPTITLLNQWRKLLDQANIPNLEWGTDLNNLGPYFADPSHRVLVTLYSRFFDQYREYYKRAKILRPSLLLILDECHNSYGHLDNLYEFDNLIQSFGNQTYRLGLSATIDSFREDEVKSFVSFMNGNDNRFEISLQRFYSYWNRLNSTLVLKPLRYIPLKYNLTLAEMDEFKTLSKNVAIQFGKSNMGGTNEPTAAIKRARWLRSLPGGVRILQNYIASHIDGFSDKASIIFVQTHEIAEHLRDFITKQPGWNPDASTYVYDSSKSEDHNAYAFGQFKKNLGYCLISEKMLSEGFDLPKVDRVILHGSDKSERDWIQKIGRALRFDPKNPNTIAEIIDIVFCETNSVPLLLERERYETLLSIDQISGDMNDQKSR
ncbi:MAG: DEAD/DEAH box helicase family protein [Candidatus Bathyarchaeia archaeon]|jgi:superfamily II DNA or RNA helicase